VAVECSSSRPSRPAASHATGRRRLSSQSGSTPHERGRHVSHPHRQARFPLVTIQPRRRSTGQLPGSAFNKAIFPESHRHRGSSEPETHQRRPSPDGRALASCVRRQRRDQIAIAPASPSAPHLPRVPSLEAFGRRPGASRIVAMGRHPKPFTTTDSCGAANNIPIRSPRRRGRAASAAR
jgi:hypothetical protein